LRDLWTEEPTTFAKLFLNLILRSEDVEGRLQSISVSQLDLLIVINRAELEEAF